MIRISLSCLKPISFFLAILVFFQYCKAYYKEPVSIEKAVGSDKKRVKIITMDDRRYIFDSIYYENDVLYGHLLRAKNKSELVIPEDSIKEIHLANTRKSRILTALLIIVPIGIFFAFQLAPEPED
jgi:hypothetical protein